MSVSVTSRVAGSGNVHKFQANIPGTAAADPASPFSQLLDAAAAGATGDQDSKSDTDTPDQQDGAKTPAKSQAGDPPSSSQAACGLALGLANLVKVADKDSTSDNDIKSATSAPAADADRSAPAGNASSSAQQAPAAASADSGLPGALQALIQAKPAAKTNPQQPPDDSTAVPAASDLAEKAADASPKADTGGTGAAKPSPDVSPAGDASGKEIIADALTPAPPAEAGADKTPAPQKTGKDQDKSATKDKSDRKADRPVASTPDFAQAASASAAPVPLTAPQPAAPQGDTAGDKSASGPVSAAGDASSKAPSAGQPARAQAAPPADPPPTKVASAGGTEAASPIAPPPQTDGFTDPQAKASAIRGSNGKASAPATDKTDMPAPVQTSAMPQQPIAPPNATDNTASPLTQAPPVLHGASDAPALGQHVQVSAADGHTTASLAVAIAAKSQSGNKEFEIRLDPPELGRVEIRLSIDQNGKAQANLAADQPRTLDLLRSDAPQLQRALRDAGLNVAQNGLNFSLRGQDRQNANSNRGGARPSRPSLSLTAIGAIGTVQGGANYRGPLDGRLDIRV